VADFAPRGRCIFQIFVQVRAMRSFAKSVLIGTLVGAAPALLITLPLALLDLIQPMGGRSDLIRSLWLGVLPLIVAFSLVLPCTVLIGLPVHFVLQKIKIGRAEPYALVGAVFGIGVPLLILVLIGSDNYWLVILGCISGAATGWSWSLERSAVS
jgi:hypothetical protein